MARIRFLAVIALATAFAAHGAATDLTGRVAAGGAPVAGATVTARVSGGAVTAESRADGRFTLHLPEPAPDTVTLTVAATGMQTLTLAVTDLARPLSIVLQPARVFSDAVEVTATRARSGESPVTFSNVTREEIERGSWGQDVPMFLSQLPGFYAYNDNGNDNG